MAKYWTCENGANHDIGEPCDCKKVEQEERELRERWMRGRLATEKGGQLVIKFGREASA